MLSEAAYLKYVRTCLTSLLPSLEQLSDRAWREWLYQRCAADFFFWLRWFGVIVDRDSGKVTRGLTLWRGIHGHPGQYEYLTALLDGKDVITGKARQLGISWLATNFDCWEMLFKANIGLAVIAQNDDYAMRHIERLRQVYDNQPKCIRRKQPVVGFDNQHTLGIGTPQTLSVCTALVPDPNTARGISARRIRCEEFAHWANASEVYLALRGSTADAGRQVLITSTANGEGNKYHELWTKARTGELPDLHALFFPWDTHPGRQPDFKRRMVAEHGAPYANQEWPDTEEQMFIASGDKYFDSDCLIMAGMHIRPLEEAWQPFPGWYVYNRFESGKLYALYGDPADAGGDECSLDIIELGEDYALQVAHISSFAWGWDGFADQIATAGEMWGWSLAGVERENHGHAVNERLINVLKYPRVYRHREWDPAAKQHYFKPGYPISANRPLVLVGLANALRSATLRIQHGPTLQQLRAFAWINGKPQAPPTIDGKKGHDDKVFSIAGSVKMREEVLYGQRASEPIRAYVGAERVR